MNLKHKKFDIVALFLLIGVFMAALDNGIISAALTTINQSFEISAQMLHRRHGRSWSEEEVKI